MPFNFDPKNFNLTKEEFIGRYARRRLRCPWQQMVVSREELDQHIATYGSFSSTPPEEPGAEPRAEFGFDTFEPDVSSHDDERVAIECQQLRTEIAAAEPLMRLSEFYDDL